MVRKTVVILACLAMIVVLGACAKKSGYTSVDEVYTKYDTDKNGVITKEEFASKWTDKQKADTAWKKLDSKNNGFVSRAMAGETPLDVWSDVESNNMP
ncbi:MAG: calcium-binding protein [Solidesulfovibrio sp.]